MTQGIPLKGKEITISVIVSRINEAGTERAAEVESPLVLNGRTAEIDVLMSGILVLIQFVSWSRDKKASGLKTAHIMYVLKAEGAGEPQRAYGDFLTTVTNLEMQVILVEEAEI